jgi:hypothetical protein
LSPSQDLNISTCIAVVVLVIFMIQTSSVEAGAAHISSV